MNDSNNHLIIIGLIIIIFMIIIMISLFKIEAYLEEIMKSLIAIEYK